jgi:hypothetical protein
MLALSAAATIIIAAAGVTAPEHRYVSACFFLIGLVSTWRHYRRWRQAG